MPHVLQQTVNEKYSSYAIINVLTGSNGFAFSPKRFPTNLLQRSKVHLCDVLSTSTQQQKPSFTFTNRGIKRDSSKINRAAPGSFITFELVLAALTVAQTTLCHCVRFTISLCLSFAHLFS